MHRATIFWETNPCENYASNLVFLVFEFSPEKAPFIGELWTKNPVKRVPYNLVTMSNGSSSADHYQTFCLLLLQQIKENKTEDMPHTSEIKIKKWSEWWMTMFTNPEIFYAILHSQVFSKVLLDRVSGRAYSSTLFNIHNLFMSFMSLSKKFFI